MATPKPKAVVFAYHNVGVRCLLTLLARGVEVPLVVTHRDSPNETIWFDSVAEVARAHRIDVLYADGLAPDYLRTRVAGLRPDYLFSFYFRNLLPPALLETARRGAYNLHGSLLPKYRGRVPVNWAIIHGETETGATLHEMVAKPDAGAIVAQTAVPILPDDTAFEVFGKVTVAAEQTLWRVLPALLAGTAPRLPNDLAQGSYYGGRKPEDGRIDWHASAKAIHDLVRAVAPPYPGATTMVDGRPIVIEKTRRLAHAISPTTGLEIGSLLVANHTCVAVCAKGEQLRIVGATVDGVRLDEAGIAARFGNGPHSLGERR